MVCLHKPYVQSRICLAILYRDVCTDFIIMYSYTTDHSELVSVWFQREMTQVEVRSVPNLPRDAVAICFAK